MLLYHYLFGSRCFVIATGHTPHEHFCSSGHEMLCLIRPRQPVAPSSRLVQPHLLTHLSPSMYLLD
jgi:hypothetical protein